MSVTPAERKLINYYSECVERLLAGEVDLPDRLDLDPIMASLIEDAARWEFLSHTDRNKSAAVTPEGYQIAWGTRVPMVYFSMVAQPDKVEQVLTEGASKGFRLHSIIPFGNTVSYALVVMDKEAT